jgi:hypothetical protein
MGSSDKSKIGSGLIKDEIGQVRLNAIDAKEGSKFNDFRDLHGDRAYSSLFPTNYNAKYIGGEGTDGTHGLNGLGGYGRTAANTFHTSFANDEALEDETAQCILDLDTAGTIAASNVNARFGVLMFQSMAMPDCFVFTANQSSYTTNIQKNTTYSVLIDCSMSTSVQVKKVMEAKAAAWFNKNFDAMQKRGGPAGGQTIYQSATSLDANGTLVVNSNADTDKWGNNSDGLFGATHLIQ